MLGAVPGVGGTGVGGTDDGGNWELLHVGGRFPVPKTSPISKKPRSRTKGRLMLANCFQVEIVEKSPVTAMYSSPDSFKGILVIIPLYGAIQKFQGTCISVVQLRY